MGYEALIPALQLPDPDDRHVLAAAIHAQAQVILTSNLRDFPATALASYGIVRQGPDEFLTWLVEQHPAEVQTVIEEMRARKTRPPVSLAELLQKLAQQNLPQFVARLQALFAL